MSQKSTDTDTSSTIKPVNYTLRIDLCFSSTDMAALLESKQAYEKWVDERITEGMTLSYSKVDFHRG